MDHDRPSTPDDVKALVEERDIRFIRLWFTDILGQLKSFSINATELRDAFEGGMGFDGSSITGFNAIEESDMIALPDPSTFAVLPWRPEDEGGGVARMFSDIQTLDAGSDVRRDTVLALEKFGIQVEYSHHEVGPSQHEIDMRYADALKMADDCMTYRITVKEIALKYGWHATFMPKPLFGENGSGMHTHQSLFKNGRNAFYDADDRYFLSDVGKAFIAGQLRHAREVCSIFAQWVNSYKRLVPGYEAPVYVAWSRWRRTSITWRPTTAAGSASSSSRRRWARRSRSPRSPSSSCARSGSTR